MSRGFYRGLEPKVACAPAQFARRRAASVLLRKSRKLADPLATLAGVFRYPFCRRQKEKVTDWRPFLFGRGGRTIKSHARERKRAGRPDRGFCEAKRRCSADERSERERSDPGFESFGAVFLFGRGKNAGVLLRFFAPFCR